MKVTKEELHRRIALPLDEKILWAKEVIVEFFAQFNGEVFIQEFILKIKHSLIVFRSWLYPIHDNIIFVSMI